jgi:hypothetical protein
MTDSAQVVQTNDEKHSGKRVKPYVKPEPANGLQWTDITLFDLLPSDA